MFGYSLARHLFNEPQADLGLAYTTCTMQEKTLSLLLFIDTGGKISLKIGENVCAACEQRTRSEGVRDLQWICVDQLAMQGHESFTHNRGFNQAVAHCNILSDLENV